MKKSIIIFLLFAGFAVPAAAQVWETSAESSRSEHRLQMTGGTSQWALMPLSTQTLRSSSGSQQGISGGGLVSIGAGAPSVALSGGALPQVQFGRGTVGNGELVSDPTRTINPRYGLGGGSGTTEPGSGDNPGPYVTPIGDMPWWLMLLLAALIVILRSRKAYKRA